MFLSQPPKWTFICFLRHYKGDAHAHITSICGVPNVLHAHVPSKIYHSPCTIHVSYFGSLVVVISFLLTWFNLKPLWPSFSFRQTRS